MKRPAIRDPARTPLVIIPFSSAVTFECVRVPKETPLGVMEGSTMRVSFDGRRFETLEMSPDSGDFVDAMDVATGDVVRLFVEGPPAKH